MTLLNTAADCFAANPYIGIWKFNEAKSKMHAGVTKNNTITYIERQIFDLIFATHDLLYLALVGLLPGGTP